MTKFFPIINIGLVLGIMLLTTLSVQTWTHPVYPSRVDGSIQADKPRILEKISLKRRTYGSNTVSSAVQKNLFRKERKEYVTPVATPPPKAKVVPKPALPPPKLKLKGVMLLAKTRIAILEGTISVMDGKNTKDKPLKRRGFSLGAKIGDYVLTSIEKGSVTLDNKKGGIIHLNLSDRPAGKVIKRQGNTLIQKSKNFTPKDLKKADVAPRPKPAAKPSPAAQPPVVNQLPPQPRQFRISGSPSPSRK